MRSIGMDVHRSFAQVAVFDRGKFTAEFRVELEHDAVAAFGQSLRKDDEVVLEATGNTSAIVRLLTPFVARVVIANPLQVKAIAHARVKTDKVDAKILAQLHAAGFLPEVWVADDETQNLRRLVSERAALVRSARRVKSRVQAVLHANLVPRYAGHLFGKGGRRWLSTAPLPKAERDLLARHLDELDWLNGKLEKLDCALARLSLDDARTRKLMSIAGISSVVATAVIAAIGDISRFPTPDRLASYFGLTPRVRQSGDRGAIHGRISKQGNTVARTMLIEAAWSAASVPGPLRAFFLRIKDRKGLNVAAVATARKLANLIWQLLTKEEPYRWARPAFVAMKMRKLELRAGAPRAHGPAGPGRDYWIKEIRHREMDLVAQAEAAYAAMVEAWRDRPPKPPKG
jgi:transposase